MKRHDCPRWSRARRLFAGANQAEIVERFGGRLSRLSKAETRPGEGLISRRRTSLSSAGRSIPDRTGVAGVAGWL
jgi:hypothetical protein